ncbi:hypothetical protein [Ruegeria atlantica]|uniref:hypothetical protein n=1 Tax=Ruegeria atlantica TaxID=81569 RepID=UPI00147A15F3|nr:hypothetical protein [Ruegeria atlantica]
MSKDTNTDEHLKRRLKLCANDDLLSEVKTRIEIGELKETLLFHGATGRVYSDLGREDRRCLPPDAVLRLVFPFHEFDPDSISHQNVYECLFDLPDEYFSALKSTVAAETEKGLHRLVAVLEKIASVQESQPPRTGDPADE